MVSGFVLHLDVDACFAQVEQLRDPSLQGRAVAVQQHQDIIAANHEAKAAGVRKHMAPAEARRLLAAVGGRVVHVHLADGGRVSYRPYREMSGRLMRLLRALPWAAEVEKASIDEAYIQLAAASTAGSADTAGSAGDAAAGAGVAAQLALQRAREAKDAVHRELGLTVSVGAAPNRLVAKLASAAAKPGGVRLVADQAASLQLLAQTPARKLPGYGGKAAEVFEQRGIKAATDLQRYSQHQLEQLLGSKPAAAAQLIQWCRGLDDTPVQDRGPPKQLSVQMSLTPQLLSMHPSQGRAVSASGGRAGVLEPLVVGKPDFRPRVRQLAAALGLDLLQRVIEDKEEEGRWPRTLGASIRAFGAGRDQAFTTRSAGFPALGLLSAPKKASARPATAGSGQRQQQQQQQDQQQQMEGQQDDAGGEEPGRQQGAAGPSAQQGEQPQGLQGQGSSGSLAGGSGQQELSALEEAVVSGLEHLVHQASATYPPTATLVELRLSASSFESAAAAAAAAPITRFFGLAPKQQQMGQQEGHQREEVEEKQAGQCGSNQREAQQAAGGEQASGAAGETGEPAVDLDSVDVAEQARILEQIQQQQQTQQQQPGGQQPQRQKPQGQKAGTAAAGKRGTKRGAAKGAGGSGEDRKQPKISAFLQH